MGKLLVLEEKKTSVGEPMSLDGIDETVPLTHDKLRRIKNLHVVTKPGELNYRIVSCVGEMSGSVGGATVIVDIAGVELPREGFGKALGQFFKENGKFAKIMNLWEPDVISKRWS